MPATSAAAGAAAAGASAASSSSSSGHYAQTEIDGAAGWILVAIGGLMLLGLVAAMCAIAYLAFDEAWARGRSCAGRVLLLVLSAIAAGLGVAFLALLVVAGVQVVTEGRI